MPSGNFYLVDEKFHSFKHHIAPKYNNFSFAFLLENGFALSIEYII